MLLKTLKIGVVVVAVLGLVACASKKGNRWGSSGGNDEVGGIEENVRFYGTNLSPAEEKQLLAQRTYYFALNSNELSDNDVMSINAHAKRLVNASRTRIRVEGHTDERGSREYNVALAERRANAVANVLILKGVPQEQISVVSYGKEKPAVVGHDEAAWSKNRRAVIVYEVE